MANISEIMINNTTYNLQDTIAKKEINEFSKQYPIFKIYVSDSSERSTEHTINPTDSSLYHGYYKLQIRTVYLMNDSCSLYMLRPFILADEPSGNGQLLTALFMKYAKNEGFEHFMGDEPTSQMLIRRRIGIGDIRTMSSHVQFLNPLEYRYWSFAIGIKTSETLTNVYSSLQSYILTKGIASWGNTSGTNTISRKITIS